MNKLYLSLLLLGSLFANPAFGKIATDSVVAHPPPTDAFADTPAPTEGAPPPTFTTESVQIVSHPNQYIENHKFDRYVIVVAIDRTDPTSQKYLDHRLPQIESLLKEKNIPYQVQYVEQDLIEEFQSQHEKVISELKDTNNMPKAVAAHFDDGGEEQMGKLRKYWRKIYVPATSEAMMRGLMFGSMFQSAVTAATGHFIESKIGLPLWGQVGVISIFSGILGVWNETYRNFLRMPDTAAATLFKAMGTSAIFAVPMKLFTDEGRAALLTIAGCAKILEHCFLSQVAKVYLTRILLFREKMGYLSSKKSFYWNQVGLFGVYLFFRICHLNDVPFLSYGFYAMGPIGFLSYLGYQTHLNAIVRNSKRFYTLSDVESGRIILTEVSKSFEDEFLKAHPKLATLNSKIENRDFRDKYFRRYYLKVITGIFMDEVKGISKSLGGILSSGFQACGRIFSKVPLHKGSVYLF